MTKDINLEAIEVVPKNTKDKNKTAAIIILARYHIPKRISLLAVV